MEKSRPECVSCEWIEGGISFHPQSLNFCAIPHHNTGQPEIARFFGGPVPVHLILSKRQSFRKANNSSSGHRECKGCTRLAKKPWPNGKYLFSFIAINNSLKCNLQCYYCFLHQKEFKMPDRFIPYSLRPSLEGLFERGLISPDAVVDWGGGGEPALNEEFDDLIQFLLPRVSQIFIHTNATILSNPLLNDCLRSKLHVICSVDAGNPETFVKIKNRDKFDQVWFNLSSYSKASISVTLKYIVTPFNLSRSEISAFVDRAAEIGVRSLIADIDHRSPVPDSETVKAILHFLNYSKKMGIYAKYGYVGDFYRPENKISERIRKMRETSDESDYNIKLVDIKTKRTEHQRQREKGTAMQYRRLGRTELDISVVGFGTAQLRLIPQKNAVNILRRGIELGVNIIHTSPDYEGALDIVARAVSEQPEKVIVASQGYDVRGNSKGSVSHFEALFESTLKKLKTDYLDIYGIAGIENREALQENVWMKNGMVNFLLKQKEAGRIGSIYCTTHGSPEYIRSLLLRDVFDAIMIPYNVLGFHLLSAHTQHGGGYEDLLQNRQQVIPFCAEKDIGLMIMKPYAGGILVPGKAFPARFGRPEIWPVITPSDALRHILELKGVSCVMPGTASMEEAEENAYAGWGMIDPEEKVHEQVKEQATLFKQHICSRCGDCRGTCSKDLNIPHLFRSAFLNLYPSEPFEDWPETQYFNLHPAVEEALCSSCEDKTCICSNGMDIPGQLIKTHDHMLELLERGLVPALKNLTAYGDESFGAKVLIKDIPDTMVKRGTYRCCLFLQNCGKRGWFSSENQYKAKVALKIVVGMDERLVTLRHDVHTDGRCHFSFVLQPPENTDMFSIKCFLLSEHLDGVSPGIKVVDKKIRVTESPEDISNRDNRKTDTSDMEERQRTEDKSKKAQPQANLLFAEQYKDDLKKQTYDVVWLSHNLPHEWEVGIPYRIYLEIENRGTRIWTNDDPEGKIVYLAVYNDGDLIRMEKLPSTTGPGERAQFSFSFIFPETNTTDWKLKFSLLEHEVAWFEKEGADPLKVTVSKETMVRGETKTFMTVSQQSNSAFYMPSGGIVKSRSGHSYPTFIKYANGCRFKDLEENEWIDYIMGWGSALLGYAHPRIQKAIAKSLDSGAIVSLPHYLEMSVTRKLCEMIPCSEMVLFGKNGSDVCTAAIRMARLYTGKSKILYSGYHGWHDWYADCVSPELKRISLSHEVFHTPLNNIDAFYNLIREYQDDIAAFILEPAAQAESIEGPVQDADPFFLNTIADICREKNIVLIFDEIITGFRHTAGSVQKSTGVVPDMACFGKALSGGMPLSAVVGKHKIMSKTISKAFYHPTFKGETYSFAAAEEALELYRQSDIPKQIKIFGSTLMAKINEIGLAIGIDGQMIGQPYRMVYRFNDSSVYLKRLKRTMLQQELMKNGIVTFNGYLLPSIAHGEAEMTLTVAAYQNALTKVLQTSNEQSFIENLEIPLL